VIEVRDNGIGIAKQHQERIFQVFERLHSTDAYPGTGIGLAIVKRGITRMGGTVRVESEPGKGSTFFISLPSS
jgi:signal transduction histidine kinase